MTADTSRSTAISVDKKVSALMDEIAEASKTRLGRAGVFSVNIMGAPGSGKTSVLEQISRILSPKKLAAIQGDLESDIDKQRLEAAGIPTIQINTHSGCHLNAKMVADALAQLSLNGREFLLIENVGNLVCPATKKIGQHLNVLVSSTTEGSDKPRKYPIIFRETDMLVITKDDLSEAVSFDAAAYLRDVSLINPTLQVFRTSTKRADCWAAVAEALLTARTLYLRG